MTPLVLGPGPPPVGLYLIVEHLASTQPFKLLVTIAVQIFSHTSSILS